MASENLEWKSAARGRRWTTAVAEAVLRELTGSGLSRVEFAALHGIHEQRLYQWQRRLAASAVVKTEALSPVPFREVRVPEERGEQRFEVVLPSGLVLRVPALFEAGALNRLLQALLGNG